MKLHLPKSLFMAVLATFVSQPVCAGEWGTNGGGNTYNVYYVGAKEETVDATVKTDITEFYLAQAVDGADATGSKPAIIDQLLIKAGDTLTIKTHPWRNDGSVNFSLLTIVNFVIGDGTQQADFVVNANQGVLLNQVSGSFSSVSNAGVLTLNSATISGNVNNSGTLTLRDVEINGTVTNSGTLKLTGTLAGSGSVTGGLVEFDASGNLAYYDGMVYKYAGSNTANDIKVGFITGEQTFRVFGEGVTYTGVVYDYTGNECTVSDGSVTMNVGNSTIFYVDDSWNYNAEQSAEASAFYVTEAGEMAIAAGMVPTVTVDNHGTVVLEQGENNIVLNTIVGRDKGAYNPDVISNAVGGNLVISNSGNKTLSSDIILGNGGKVTLKGGTFGTSTSAITNTITSSNTVLAFEDIEAYIGGGDVRMLNINLEVGKGATLTLLNGDRMHYNTAYTLKVLTGGVVELGATRQTLAGGYVVEMAGGVINGTGDQAHKISLDFYKGGTVKATENSIINAHVGGHDDNATIEFNVAQEKTLTLSGNLVKTGVTKSGLGTLLYQGAGFSKSLSITAGVFDFNVAKGLEVSHSGAFSGAGTFRKSGEGTLNLTGAAGTASNNLGTLEVAEGVLKLSGNNAKQLLSLATGTGEINLATNVQFKDSTTLSFKGTLSVASGKTLQMGDNEGDKVDSSSLQEIRLDGGNIYYQAQGSSWKHLNVTADSYVHICDMNAENAEKEYELTINKVTVAEDATLTINGSSISGVGVPNTWNHQLDIKLLTGDGSAVFNGPGTDDDAISTLYIDSLSGFTGDLVVKSHETDAQKRRYSSVVKTGVAGVAFNKLEVSGFKTQTFTFVVEGDTQVNTLLAANSIVKLEKGVSLTLGDGTTETTSSIGTLTAHSDGNTIHLNKGATLNAFTKGADSGTITLTGSGVYDMGSNISSTIVSGLTDADNWQGKVIIRDNQSVVNLNLSALGNANSWVQLKNLKGHWSNTDNNKNVATNLILGNEQGDSVDAFTFDNAYSVMEYTIAGQVKGTGNLVVVRNKNNPTVKTRFTGDVSEWSGVYKNDNATSELTFAGNASTVNAVIERVNEGSLHLTVATDAAASFNKDVTVSKLTLNQSATFNKQLNVSGEVSLVSGKTLQMGENYSISSSADVAMKGVKLTATEIAGAGTGAEISNSVIAIKKNASLTFKDIMMSGVQLNAASADTYVKLKLDNVTQNDRLVLTQGKFELQAMANPVSEAVVKTGNTTIEYQIGGTPQLTLGTANATVVISADPAMDCGQVLGVYDLVFDMDLQYTVGSGVTEFDWSTVVSFGGPLAELLAGTTDPALLGAEAITALNNPYVTYDYTIVDGLATLNSVTVHGITAPEPTTATLSLIALAALAARRRRK